VACLTLQKADDEAKKKEEEAKKKAEEAKKVSIYAAPLPAIFNINPCPPATPWALRFSWHPVSQCSTSGMN